MHLISAFIAIITVLLPPPSTLAHQSAMSRSKSHSQAQLAIQRGKTLFRKGNVEGSLAEFDRAIELDPGKRVELWQRGLSLYYLNRFKEGAEQFRSDVTKSRNDTEEAIWWFLCESQLYGAAQARAQFLKVGRDRRLVMRKAYKLFKDGADPEKFVNAFCSKPKDFFYASLYAGLYYEAQDEKDAAKRHIVAAYKSPYGQSSNDYMADLAKVHCQRRNWIDD